MLAQPLLKRLTAFWNRATAATDPAVLPTEILPATSFLRGIFRAYLALDREEQKRMDIEQRLLLRKTPEEAPTTQAILIGRRT